MKEWTVDELKAPTPNALATGPFGSAISSKHFTATGVPVIRGSNLSQDIGVRLDEEGLAFLEPAKAAEFSRSVARRGDLVFTCWGTIDQVGYIDERASYPEYVVSNKQMKLTTDPKTVDSLYLYYYFSQPTVRQQILDSGIGSSVPGFNLGQLRKMRVRLPSLDIQRKVVRQLDALDARIEQNRRMSQTLQAISQTIFKAWFADFEPVIELSRGQQPTAVQLKYGLSNEAMAAIPVQLTTDKGMQLPNGWAWHPFFNRPKTQLIFRGSRRFDWTLTPSLGRLDERRIITKEVAAAQLRLFQRAVRGRIEDRTLVDEEHELWSVGQHHGLHTPLLDWTYSPYVAPLTCGYRTALGTSNVTLMGPAPSCER